MFFRNDDWAFANDVDAKSIYIQTEEFVLQANINRFHNRRYEKPYPNNINSVTAQALSCNLNSAKMSDYGGGGGSASTASNGGYGGGATSSTAFTATSPSTPLSSSSSIFFDNIITGGQVDAFASGINPSLAAIAEVDLFQPVDNNLLSVLSKEIELTKEFKKNYETWLEAEVFRYKINWDQL